MKLGLSINVNQAAGVLTANEAGAVYQWLDCEDMGAISGETSQSYTASTNGDYAVMITANGCTDTSSCLTIEGLGLEPMNKETKVSFFPNPTDGEITVFLNEASTNNTEFKILDLQGKLILSQNLVGNKMVIDLSAIEAGVYIYVLDDGTSGKIIKK